MDATAPRPIILGGCHRSGTSLIRQIQNFHSRIHCGPGVKGFRDFYNDLVQGLLRPLRFATSGRGILPEAELLEMLGRAFTVIHECAAGRGRGKNGWVDRSTVAFAAREPTSRRA